MLADDVTRPAPVDFPGKSSCSRSLSYFASSRSFFLFPYPWRCPTPTQLSKTCNKQARFWVLGEEDRLEGSVFTARILGLIDAETTLDESECKAAILYIVRKQKIRFVSNLKPTLFD